MENNLVPSFLLCEEGIHVNECPKIHSENPPVEDHSIYFKDKDLKIPLKLKGVFSYFNHQVPRYEEIDMLEVIFLTPDSTSWDPHSDHYANEEEAFLDKNSFIVDKPRKKKKTIVDDYDLNDEMQIDSCEVNLHTMPTVEKIDETINALINSVIADFPGYKINRNHVMRMKAKYLLIN